MSFYSAFNPGKASRPKISSSIDPGITLDLPLDNSGYKDISTTLTANGQTVEASAFYVADDIRENLFSYTEDFSNGVWQKYNSACDSNVATDPLGSNTADGLVASSAGGAQNEVRFRYYGSILVPGEIYTYSVYLKSSGRTNWANLLVGSYGFPNVYYNISSGVVGQTTLDNNGAIFDKGIEDAGNGWYRCWFTFRADAALEEFRIRAAEGDANYSVDLDGSTYLYIWGAQVNSGPLKPYYNAAANSVGPVFDWKAKKGDDLSIDSTSSPSINQYGPFTDDSTITKSTGSGYRAAADNAFHDVGTRDFVVRCVFYFDPDVGNSVVFAKGGIDGWAIGMYVNTYIRLQITGSVSTTQYFDTNINGAVGWIDFMAACKYKGSDNWDVRTYINGQQAFSSTDRAIGSITSTRRLSVLSNGDAGQVATNGRVAFCGLWIKDSWLSATADMDEAAQRAHLELTGILPRYAGGDDLPLVQDRNADAWLDIYHDYSEKPQRNFHRVTKDWMRLCRRKDGYGEIFSGYLSEDSSTQRLGDTDDLTTTWVTANVSVLDGYESFTPYPDASAWSLIADSTSSTQHSVRYATTSIDADGWVSFFAKAGEVDWVACLVFTSASHARQYFDLGNEAVGSSDGDDTVDAFIEPWGNGWYRCAMKYQNGLTSTTCYLYAAGGDLTFNYAASDTSTPLAHFAFPQLEGASIPTSPIVNSSTGTVTRSADQLRFDGVGNYDGTRGYFIETKDLLYNKFGTDRAILTIGNTDFSEKLRIAKSGPTDANYYLSYNDAGTLNFAISGNNNSNYNKVITSRVVAEKNNQKVYLNEASDGTDITGTPATTVDWIDIGRRTNGTQELNGLVSGIRIKKHPVFKPKPVYSDDPGITFDLPLNTSGPSQLPINMTVNGTEVEPIFRYSSSGIRENQWGYTEDFSNAVWFKSDCTIESNISVAPDGTMTADGMRAVVGAGGANLWAMQYCTGYPGEVYTVSVYAKARSKDWIFLSADQNVEPYPLYPRAHFNLRDGVVGSTTDGVVGTKIEDVGNGWFRCSMSFILGVGGGYIKIQGTSADGIVFPPKDGTLYCLIWGAQFNSGPLLPYYNAGANSAGPNRKWFADVGPDLEYGGSGSDILLKPGPFTDGTPVVKFNSTAGVGRMFIDAVGTPGPGVKDWVFEIVAYGDNTSGILMEWPDTNFATNPRAEIYSGGSGYLNSVLSSATPAGTASPGSVRNMGTYNWRHQMDFFDSSDLEEPLNIRSYANAAADSRSVTGAITDPFLNMSVGKLAIGGRVHESSVYNGTVAFIAVYAKADVFPGGTENYNVFENIIKERSAQVMGVYPRYAAGDSTPLTATRTTNNSFLDIQDDSGYRSLHQVAKGWMRTCRREDGYGEMFSGYLSEEASTQQLEYSDDLTQWTQGNCTAVDGYEVFYPSLDAAVWSMIPSTTSDVQFTFSQLSSGASGDGWFTCFAKAGAITKFALRGATTSLSSCYFDLENGTLLDAGIFGADAVDGFIEDWGNGWYRCVLKCQNGISSTTTIYAAEAYGDVNLSPSDTSTPLIHVCFPQVENGTVTPTSHIINSSTGTVTRGQDQLKYAGVDNFANTGQMTVQAKAMSTSVHSSIGSALIDGDKSGIKFRFYSHPSVNFYSVGYDDAGGLAWNHNTSTKEVYDGYTHSYKQTGTYADYTSYVDGVEDISSSRLFYPPTTIDDLYVGLDRNSTGHNNILVNGIKFYNKIKGES